GPGRDAGVAEVAGRHDDVRGRKVARGRADDEAVAVAVDALHRRAEAHVELVALGEAVEVADHVVAGGEDARRSAEARARQLREPAARVQAQAVVAPVPGGADRVAALEDGGRDAAAAELGRGGEAGR